MDPLLIEPVGKQGNKFHSTWQILYTAHDVDQKVVDIEEISELEELLSDLLIYVSDFNVMYKESDELICGFLNDSSNELTLATLKLLTKYKWNTIKLLYDLTNERNEPLERYEFRLYLKTISNSKSDFYNNSLRVKSFTFKIGSMICYDIINNVNSSTCEF